MERRNILDNLRVACTELNEFLNTRAQDWLITIITSGKDLKTDVLLKDHRLYEILCYFSLINSIKDRVNVTFIPSPQKNGHRIPYGPALKENYCFFRFEQNSRIYDVCCGTRVPAKDNKNEHPDISLQLKSQNDKSSEPGELIAIWDAKHCRKVSKDALQQMNWWFTVLKIPRCNKNDILGAIMPSHFQVSAILTDAERMDDVLRERILLEQGFSFVFEFDGDGDGDGPLPSREQHLRQSENNNTP